MDPPRTIDDFLEQIYQEYKQRLPYPAQETGASPPSSNLHDGARSSPRRFGCCHWVWQCRHYLPLPLLSLCVANSSDATEILMLSYLLANPTFRHEMLSGHSNDDNGDSSSMEGAEYLAASIFFGMLLGGTLMGFLSDHIGRRPALLAGLLINATAGFFSSLPILTPTIRQLTMWRFFAGIGVGATVPSLFSLASEWSPKEVRGAVVTLVASFWMVGSVLVSGLAWVLFRWDHNGQDLPIWRVFAALCAFPSGLGAWLVYLHVPESPRFLASAKQKYDISADACNTMAASLGVKLMNDENANDMELSDHNENKQPEKDALIEGTDHSNSISSMLSDSVVTTKPLAGEEIRQDYPSGTSTDNSAVSSSFITRIRQMLNALLQTLQKLYSTRLLTHTTLPLQIIWFALSFGTYGITTWINTLFVSVHLQNIYFNSFLFALANLPGNILSILYSDKWGRKRLLVWSLLGASGGLAVFAVLVYSGNSDDRSSSRTYGIVLSACLFQMFSIVAWNAIDILTGELFPTRVRSAGMGVCTACGRFGAMFAQFVNAKLMMAKGDEGGLASASVLVVAASTLLMGAGMPLFLERDMAMGELKDEVAEETATNRIVTLGCMGMKSQKDHLSDEEVDQDAGLRNRNVNEYQAIQRAKVLECDSFCLL